MNHMIKLYLDNLQRVKPPINKAENSSALYIYDVISPYGGVCATSVAAALAELCDIDVLNVYINSPGGDVFESRAIMAELRRFTGKTVAHIDSVCASAATSIALACNEVVMSDGAFFMIHNAKTLAYGDKHDFREKADVLEKIEGAIIADYTTKTGKSDEEIMTLMDEETWFTAAEALDHGFIDRVIQEQPVQNTWDLSAFSKTPSALKAPEVKGDDQNLNVSESGVKQANMNKLKLMEAM